MVSPAAIVALFVGFAVPALTIDPPPEHCTSGCGLKIVSAGPTHCPEVTVTVTVLDGNPGVCECQGEDCQVAAHCDLDLRFTFSLIPGLDGCVYNRPLGTGTWGTGAFDTTVEGCGKFGDSCIVGYSKTCDSNEIACQAQMDVYCALCAGECP